MPRHVAQTPLYSTTRKIATLDGVAAAKLVGLRAMARSQGIFGTFPATTPGGSYSDFVFLRDFFYSAESYPGFYTGDYVRAVVDDFARSIGGHPGGTDMPAEHTNLAGRWLYAPGPNGEYGTAPTMDNAPYFVLLTALAYDRGATEVYAAHRSLFDRVLQASPRDVNGLIEGGSGVLGWGFTDSVLSANTGGMGIVTALHAVAYYRAMSMANAEGDTAMASFFRQRGDVLKNALSALRLPGNYYGCSTTDPQADVILTGKVVFYGLASEAECLLSANALLTDYNASSAFGGIGAHGGNIAQRGGIRHLVYPAYFAQSAAPPDTYQNGPAWLGPWTAWVAYALELASPGKGKELLQDAVDELLREHRINGTGPWEYSLGTNTRGSILSGAASGFLAYVDDAAQFPAWSIPGDGGDGELRVAHGLQTGRFALHSLTPANVTVEIAAQAEVNTFIDPRPITSPNFAVEEVITTIALAGYAAEGVEQVLNTAAFGGKLLARVVAGSSAEPVTVIPLPPTTPVPPQASPPPVIDPWLTSNFAAYSVVGDWVMGGGKLTTVDPDDASCCLYTGLGVVADGEFYFHFNSPYLTTGRLPAFVFRSDASALNCLGIMFATDSLTLFMRVGGSFTALSSTPLGTTEGTTYEARISLHGAAVTVYRNDKQVLTSAVPAGSGFFGPYIGVAAGTGIVEYSNFAYEAVAPTMPLVPPGFVAISSRDGACAGERYPRTPIVLRDADGFEVARTAEIPSEALLKSPNGTVYSVTVDDGGVLVTTVSGA